MLVPLAFFWTLLRPRCQWIPMTSTPLRVLKREVSYLVLHWPRVLAKDLSPCARRVSFRLRLCRSIMIDREKLMVPDARHMEASVVDPELYWNTVNAFIKRAFEL